MLKFQGDTLNLSKIVFVAHDPKRGSAVIVTPTCVTHRYEGKAVMSLLDELRSCEWVSGGGMTMVNPKHVVVWEGGVPSVMDVSLEVVEEIKRQMG